ncbi:hypothetical protein PTKIN_Ptkin15bG0125400 [Pterospermum kingtungense]
MEVRDSSGAVLLSASKHFVRTVDVLQAELLALLFGVDVAARFGPCLQKWSSDYLLAIHELRKGESDSLLDIHFYSSC